MESMEDKRKEEGTTSDSKIDSVVNEEKRVRRKRPGWFFKKIKNGFIIIAAIIGILCFGYTAINIASSMNKRASVSNEYVGQLLKEAAELNTATLTFTGITDYADLGGLSIPLINRKDFIMTYQATAKAGIDLDQVKTSVDDAVQTVNVEIPAATIRDVHVDAGTIKYFNEGFAPFNFDDKEDANKAVALAEEQAKEDLKNSGLLEMADDQAESLISGILAPVVQKGYTITFTRIPAAQPAASAQDSQTDDHQG